MAYRNNVLISSRPNRWNFTEFTYSVITGGNSAFSTQQRLNKAGHKLRSHLKVIRRRYRLIFVLTANAVSRFLFENQFLGQKKKVTNRLGPRRVDGRFGNVKKGQTASYMRACVRFRAITFTTAAEPTIQLSLGETFDGYYYIRRANTK